MYLQFVVQTPFFPELEQSFSSDQSMSNSEETLDKCQYKVAQNTKHNKKDTPEGKDKNKMQKSKNNRKIEKMLKKF